jgi:hypothetical protein
MTISVSRNPGMGHPRLFSCAAPTARAQTPTPVLLPGLRYAGPGPRDLYLHTSTSRRHPSPSLLCTHLHLETLQLIVTLHIFSQNYYRLGPEAVSA